MTQAKSKGSLALVETKKIDHIWSKLKGAQYFTILDIKSEYHHILYTLTLDQRQVLFVHMGKSNRNE